MVNLITFVLAIVVVLIIAKFILHVGVKTIVGLIINAIFGYLVLFLINLTGLITIPLTIVTSLIAGVLGIPGVILVIILVTCGII